MKAQSTPLERVETFDLSIEEPIAHLVLNRPDALNTLLASFWEDFPATIADLDSSGRIRALVISSTGRHFTAGMDLAAISPASGFGHAAGRQTYGEVFRRQIHLLQEAFTALERARFPVIAAVQGGCIGGGVDLVSACDLRVGSQDCFFTIAETNIGMTADVGTFPRLAQFLPAGVVRELAYTGRRMDADEAYALRLLNRLLPTHAEAVNAALDIAETIASKAPLAITGVKTMLNYARDHTIADTLDYLAVWQTGMFQPSALQESDDARRDGRAARHPNLMPLPRRGTGPIDDQASKPS